MKNNFIKIIISTIALGIGLTTILLYQSQIENIESEYTVENNSIVSSDISSTSEAIPQISSVSESISQLPSEISSNIVPNNFPENNRKNMAKNIMKNMTLEEKIWQMFFVTPEDIIDIGTAIQAGPKTEEALNNYPVGGIIYFSSNINSQEQITDMIKKTQSYSKIPLFISVDEEGGQVSRLGNAGIIDKQPPMAEFGKKGINGIADVTKLGEYLGTQLLKLGFNMDFAPVADVLTVENNENIGDRSFGKDPQIVAQMVSAEVKAMQNKNLCATLKHFPSNGSTATNTHKSKAVCTRTLEEMRSTEFIPFKAGIDAGADLVMMAHMTATNLDNKPATLSQTIIKNYLRGELGFNKVVITDALNMGAITEEYTPVEAVKQAINAGVDIMLMSPEVKNVVKNIVSSVKSGEITEDRIDESVERILSLKLERGIIEDNGINLIDR